MTREFDATKLCEGLLRLKRQGRMRLDALWPGDGGVRFRREVFSDTEWMSWDRVDELVNGRPSIEAKRKAQRERRAEYLQEVHRSEPA